MRDPLSESEESSGRAPVPESRPRTYEALAIREFRLLWSGAFVSNVGTWLQNVALAWLVLEITDSAFWVAMVSVAQFAPILLFGLLAGVTADRFERRRLLLFSEAVMCLAAAGLAGVTLARLAAVGTIFPLVALGGAAFAFTAPAFQALVADIVPRRLVPPAVSLNATQFSISRAIGPAIGGFVVAAAGAGAAFGINALSFLAVIGALAFMRVRPHERASPISRASFLGGFRAAREAPVVGALLTIAMVESLLSAPVVALFPVVARDVLGGGPATYGQLFAGFGIGTAIGALSVSRIAARLGYGRLVARGGIAKGALLAAFALSRSFPLSLALIALFGALYAATMVATNSGLQLATPPRRRGRVMSLFLMAFAGLYAIGALIVGAAADAFGAPSAILVSGAAVAVAAIGYRRFGERLAEVTLQ